MCQQWFTVAGLIFDAAGFLLIAFEWRHVFQREHEMRIDELEHDSERHGAKLRGSKTWRLYGVARIPETVPERMAI